MPEAKPHVREFPPSLDISTSDQSHDCGIEDSIYLPLPPERALSGLSSAPSLQDEQLLLNLPSSSTPGGPACQQRHGTECAFLPAAAAGSPRAPEQPASPPPLTVEISCWLQVTSISASKVAKQEQGLPSPVLAPTSPSAAPADAPASPAATTAPPGAAPASYPGTPVSRASPAHYAVRNPVTSIARPPRSPKRSPAPLLPAPPSSPTSRLRPVRCTPRTADRSTGDAQGACESPRLLSVRARAARLEGRYSVCDGSPLTSPTAAQTPPSRSRFAPPALQTPASRSPLVAAALRSPVSRSPRMSAAKQTPPPWRSPRARTPAVTLNWGVSSKDCSSAARYDQDSPRSPTVDHSPRCHSALRRSGEREGKGGRASFLQLARASQQGGVESLLRASSPGGFALAGASTPPTSSKRLMKPNMPSIAGL